VFKLYLNFSLTNISKECVIFDINGREKIKKGIFFLRAEKNAINLSPEEKIFTETRIKEML